jgi:cytochrome c-type biogenesis protein CcmH
MIRLFILLIMLVFVTAPALAVEPDEMLKDPVMETRARDISKNLRCLVCQNQSIDESDAELARDLRIIVRERLMAGDSDAGVLEYVVARYGDYVLLKPPFKSVTYALWFGPIFIIGITGFAGYRIFRRRKKPTGSETDLSKKEQDQLRSILTEEGE